MSTPKYVPPAVTLKGFSCPHCDVLADQTWYSAHADSLSSEDRLPRLSTLEFVEAAKKLGSTYTEPTEHRQLVNRFTRLTHGRPELQASGTGQFAERVTRSW